LQFAFLIPYAVLYAAGGRMLDIVGTRRGFILIMPWWSGACALHGLAMNFGFLLVARSLLGMVKVGLSLRRRELWRSGFRRISDRQQ
jgi:MFS transporter, ACS family, hexuronate transporter